MTSRWISIGASLPASRWKENVSGKEFGVESVEKDPAWSPDGKQLAFSSNRGEDYDIYVMDSGGGSVKQLTEASGDEVHPRWSPDGRKLGLSVYGDEASAIAVVNVDGSGLTTLRKGPDTGVIGLSDWAPDGSRIIFGVDISSSGGQLDVYVMGADGSCAEQLTDTSGDSTARGRRS